MNNYLYKQTLLQHMKTVKNVFPVEKIYLLNNELIIILKHYHLKDFLLFLKNHQLTQFKVLSCISGVDYPFKKKRFEIVYDLLSICCNVRTRIKVRVNETTSVTSCSEIYFAANWYEREIWDLFGVFFQDHPDLRRLLTDYGFEGHPLRKDFPLTGYVEVKYSESSKRVISESIELAQEYRTFDFLTPWSAAATEIDKSKKFVLKLS